MDRAPYLHSFWETHEKRMARILLLGGLVVVVGLAISSVSMDSATDDEPAHIAAGYVKLRHGYFDIFNEQPPLIDSLCAVPLLFGQFSLPPVWERTRNPWRVGTLFLYGTGNNADEMLLLARLPIIFLFAVLCIVVYRWIYDATGSRVFALLGFVLTAFCPNLLAHGRLATVDLGVTLFIYLSAYGYLRFLYAPNAVNILLTGICTGAALLSKVSGLILFPYFALVFLVFIFFESRPGCSRVLHYGWRGILILLTAAAVIESIYLLEMSHAYITAVYPDASEHWWESLTVPFHEYVKQVRAVYEWVANPYDKPQFLLGSFSKTGWWYYYFVAFGLKTPIGTLILLLFSGLILIRGILNARDLGARRRRVFFHLVALFIFVLLFFAASTASHIDLGIRYILPIYPFIYTLIPLAFYDYFASRIVKLRHIMTGSLILLWILTSTVTAHPAYLSYFNELIGDRRNADRYLIDSNLDWGQDLRRLAGWVDKNHLTRIHIAYLGGDSATYYLGVVATPWKSSLPVEKGYYAVSRHFYRESSLLKEQGLDYESYFKDAEFVTIIGGSIYVYRVH